MTAVKCKGKSGLRCFSTCRKVGTEDEASIEQTEQDSPAKHNPVRTACVNEGLAPVEFDRVTSYGSVHGVLES